METPAAWHENDNFWRETMRVIFPEGAWRKTAEELDQLIALVSPSPGCAVLDMCCGPGRHSLELARRGFHVTGVDRTQGYLDEARRRAAEENINIEFVHCDARRFSRPESFDLALNLYTSFGYFEDPADQMRMLANIYEALRPGGTFVIDLMSKEILARKFRERDWEERDGLIVLEERKIVNDWSQCENRWIVFDGDKKYEQRFRLWNYSAAEMKSMLAQSRFREIAVYGSLAGSPYDHTATRLVAVSRK
ncbi:class I SAM-dependent methyltransferase [bacterium]|nr:class I SAM-dependent methyltransferase [bacterium]